MNKTPKYFDKVNKFIDNYIPNQSFQPDLEELQFELIKNAYQYHYNNCSIYQNYSNSFNVTPDTILKPSDLRKIPLIPSTAFKLHNILSCDKKDISLMCTSSGTKGVISKVYRDECTLNNFINTWKLVLKKFFGLNNAFVINMNPTNDDAGDLWLAKAMNFIGKIFPMKNYVHTGVLMLEDIIKEYSNAKDKYENVIIIGAPIMFIRLLEYMDKNNVKIENCQSLWCLTGGGWKKNSGEQISEIHLAKKISSYFIGFRSENMRDIFNMVESNTMWPECVNKNIHLMPWVKVFILNPKTLCPLGEGQEGLIAYLDASVSSYPCFILTDDIGVLVTNNKCSCGLPGQAIKYIRRVRSSDIRGCALKIERRVS